MTPQLIDISRAIARSIKPVFEESRTPKSDRDVGALGVTYNLKAVTTDPLYRVSGIQPTN